MRLIWWAGSFIVGDALAMLTAVPAHCVLVLAPFVALLAFRLARTRHAAIAEGLVACAIGAYAGARAMAPPSLPPVIAAALDTDRRVDIEGWVRAAPTAVKVGSRLRVHVERVDGVPAPAVVALAVTNGVPDVLPGDPVRFVARLRSVRGLANPGVADTAVQARSAGIDSFAGVGAAAAVQRLVPAEVQFHAPAGMVILRWAATARVKLGRAIDAVVRGPPAVLLHTAVLGERRMNDPAVEEGFRAAGATHVLSVSGLHLAAVALVFYGGLRMVLARIPRLALWIEPRAVAAFTALPAVIFYTLVTGSAIATVRSAVMMATALVGVAIGRANTPLAAIAVAVFALLGWSPLVIVDISFQLSVVSVLALAVLVPRLLPARKGPVDDGRPAAPGTARLKRAWVAVGEGAVPAMRWVGGLGAATIAAGMTTAPLVAHHFGEVTPAAPIGNLLLVPLVELVVVPCGLGGAVLGATLGDFWGWPLLKVAGWGAQAALAVAAAFRAHAPIWLTRAPNGLETALLCIGVGLAIASARRFGAGMVSRSRLVPGTIAAVALTVATGSLTARELARRWSGNLIVTFLDIGQGDAAVIQAPGGRTVLIDGGGTYDGSFDPGARVVEPFLRARGITRLDAVAVSHPHPDHMGGLHHIVARFPVGLLWTSGDHGNNPEYWRLTADARARGVAMPVPARWEAGGVVIEPLGPFVTPTAAGVGEHIGVPEGTTVNDASLVLRAAYAGRALLFTGDIEINGEGELCGRATVGQTVASDVLKVPHHGSRTSSSDDLLDVVRPRLAVMSLGWRNRFGFPRREVVDRYRRRGVRLLRTDLHGAVTMTITPSGDLDVTCARGCP